jgi:hypothetical protein
VKTKCPQRGKLPLRTNCQSPAKQAPTIVPQENVPKSAAQVNLDEDLKDTSESSDESEEDEPLNIAQKGGDINSYDQMFAIMPHFCPTNNWKKDIMSDKTLDIFHMCKIILIGSTSKHPKSTNKRP